MRIRGFIITLVALFAGVVGFLLRQREVATVFDPVSGLAERGAPITFALAGFSLAVVLFLFGLSFTASDRHAPSFAEAFGGGPFSAILLAIFGLIVLILAGFELFRLSVIDSLDPFSIAKLGTACIAGLSLFLMAILGGRGVNVAIPASLPVFWLCVWLIVDHIQNASNPVLLSYVYTLFAKASLLLALYYIAGYAFCQQRPRRFLFWGALAIYFTGITLAGSQSLYLKGTFLALALTVLIYQIKFTKNLAP